MYSCSRVPSSGDTLASVGCLSTCGLRIPKKENTSLVTMLIFTILFRFYRNRFEELTNAELSSTVFDKYTLLKGANQHRLVILRIRIGGSGAHPHLPPTYRNFKHLKVSSPLPAPKPTQIVSFPDILETSAYISR